MVSFVYFDLGGVVIIDLNIGDKWEQLRRELGVTPERDGEFSKFFRTKEDKSLVGDDLEKMLPPLKKKFGSKLPPDYSLLSDGFISRFEDNKPIWPVIEKIHKKFKIGLLTNAYPHMLDKVYEKQIMPKVKWDVIVDSSVVRAKKPDAAIYKIAEVEAGVEGKDILFIDNMSKNTEGAERFGWNTFIYDPSNPEESNKKLLKKIG